MRVRLETVGCRLNIGEMEALARQLTRAGHRVVGPGDGADLCIVNTCTVTAVASRKSRHLIRQLRRAEPGAPVVVTGCYAELEAAAAALAGADLVVGNDGKDDLPALLEGAGLLAEADPLPDVEPSLPTPGRQGRTRAFVKVQDGCDNRCTFCVVTVARGAARSLAPGDVIAEIDHLVAAGYHEAVLTGVHLGSYGHDGGRRDGLAALVRRILEETRLARLRLSSLEPWDLDPSFFELFADRRLLPHLHLPLQSGSDAVLRRMARRTSRRRYAELLAAARAAIPELAVSTDVIVGFPGESDAEFEASLEFVEAQGFSRLHVFRYSPRAGTAAAAMSGQVPAEVAQQRSRRMHVLGARLEQEFMARHVGRTLPVLWEEALELGPTVRWSGLSANYLRVITQTPPGIDLGNVVTDTDIARVVPGALEGRVATWRAALPLV